MGTHKIARETECNPYTRPESERACQTLPCVLYAWRAEEWQEVSRAMKWAPARHVAQPPCYHHIRSPVKPWSMVTGLALSQKVCCQKASSSLQPGWESSSFLCNSYVGVLECTKSDCLQRNFKRPWAKYIQIAFTEGGGDGQNISNMCIQTWSFCISADSRKTDSRLDSSVLFLLHDFGGQVEDRP